MTTVKRRKKQTIVVDLPDYMSQVINELMCTRKYPSVRANHSALNSFRLFSESAGHSLVMSEAFTPQRMVEYQDWLTLQTLQPNTLSSYMRTLQAVYNRWMPPGTPGHDPDLFKLVNTRVSSSVKRSLTHADMQHLMSIDPATLSPGERFTLGMFMLMFYLQGMPYIDLAHLRKCDLNGNRLSYCRHKTGRPMTVTIPPEAMPWLEICLNRDPDSIYLLAILNSGEESGWELDQTYCKALRSFNRRLGSLMAKLLPHAKVSSYTARHTWATLSYYLNVPIGIISQALGHSSVRVTETYLKPFSLIRICQTNTKLIQYLKNYGKENKKDKKKQRGKHRKMEKKRTSSNHR